MGIGQATALGRVVYVLATAIGRVEVWASYYAGHKDGLGKLLQ